MGLPLIEIHMRHPRLCLHHLTPRTPVSLSLAFEAFWHSKSLRHWTAAACARLIASGVLSSGRKYLWVYLPLVYIHTRHACLCLHHLTLWTPLLRSTALAASRARRFSSWVLRAASAATRARRSSFSTLRAASAALRARRSSSALSAAASAAWRSSSASRAAASRAAASAALRAPASRTRSSRWARRCSRLRRHWSAARRASSTSSAPSPLGRNLLMSRLPWTLRRAHHERLHVSQTIPFTPLSCRAGKLGAGAWRTWRRKRGRSTPLARASRRVFSSSRFTCQYSRSSRRLRARPASRARSTSLRVPSFGW
mmetsp:Transcript_98023/g.272791  ORF Transcript_98023/g.272791 Transcript_98023/m.272791 type:complete len:312 (+) Transcript_98023:180-1115(+)